MKIIRLGTSWAKIISKILLFEIGKAKLFLQKKFLKFAFAACSMSCTNAEISRWYPNFLRLCAFSFVFVNKQDFPFMRTREENSILIKEMAISIKLFISNATHRKSYKKQKINTFYIMARQQKETVLVDINFFMQERLCDLSSVFSRSFSLSQVYYRYVINTWVTYLH